MSLPNKEVHPQTDWILEEKRKLQGKSLRGKIVTTNYANFRCDKCGRDYQRFHMEPAEFGLLKMAVSSWNWGWVN